ncbi:tyrosine-type recombinase/integrase [Salibacterium qingdaonense]|uniref:Phage integrase family protein n=1 Tax=Salibacterium qingdaonense TaxID=266892 RepID=A0A1I4R3X3_9BACI|nr:tyrosine-type recombinase/integrase [Salibacterium qingdaonense]SFM46957.1 Phage integrase family protein [Salibacterium qingdaonense]
MNFVEPIRNKKEIQRMADALYEKSERDHLLFILGVSTGFRISDLLDLRYSEILNNDGTVKDYVKLRETKTGKNNKIKITDKRKEDIANYKGKYFDGSMDAYVFPSQKKDENGNPKPMNRQQVWRILQRTANDLGIADIGSHSMRKTFGYGLFKKGVDVAVIQDMLNHSNQKETLRYIGINQDMKDEAIEALDF